LNLHVFTSLVEASVRLGAYRRHYNTERPHSQLDYLTPLEFKAAWLEAQTKVQDS
jgi:putative transposase